MGIGVPTEYGGLGLNFNTSTYLGVQLSKVSPEFSTAQGVHQSVGTLPILLYGTKEQKKRYLPKIASGETLTCYCLTEPNAGSDANSGKTKAVLIEGKDNVSMYTITGQKMWITNGGFADLFIVFAKIEDDKNITAFIVEKGAEGLTLGNEELKMGLHGSSTRMVFFSDVKGELVGPRNGGFKIAMNCLNVGRIKIGLGEIERSKYVIDLAVSYANERQ